MKGCLAPDRGDLAEAGLGLGHRNPAQRAAAGTAFTRPKTRLSADLRGGSCPNGSERAVAPSARGADGASARASLPTPGSSRARASGPPGSALDPGAPSTGRFRHRPGTARPGCSASCLAARSIPSARTGACRRPSAGRASRCGEHRRGKLHGGTERAYFFGAYFLGAFFLRSAQ